MGTGAGVETWVNASSTTSPRQMMRSFVQRVSRVNPITAIAQRSLIVPQRLTSNPLGRREFSLQRESTFTGAEAEEHDFAASQDESFPPSDPLFLVRIKYAPGQSTPKNTEKQVRKLSKAVGGDLQNFYYCLTGSHHCIGIIKVPHNHDGATMQIMARSLGLDTEFAKLLTTEDATHCMQIAADHPLISQTKTR